MTDAQIDVYAAQVQPLRDTYTAERDRLEAYAAAGVARDLRGLGGIHGDVIAWIESRWTTWLDARIKRLSDQYQRDSKRIFDEVTSA